MIDIAATLKNVTGDVIDFRIYKGSKFIPIATHAIAADRIAVGIDTFAGLGPASINDYNSNRELLYPEGYVKSDFDATMRILRKNLVDMSSVEIHKGSVGEIIPTLHDRKYAVAVVDLMRVSDTILVLSYLSTRMSDGGVIIFNNYYKDDDSALTNVIKEFIASHYNHLELPGETTVNGNYIPTLAVKWSSEPRKRNPNQEPVNPIKSTAGFSDDPVTIALVLRTGGPTYDHRYVNAVARNVRKYSSPHHKIAVLTNDSTGIDMELVDEIIPLIHDYRGWWSKIELFRPGIFTGQVFFMDLDSVIVANIDHILAWRPAFAGIRDFYHNNRMNTGFMTWTAGAADVIYEEFKDRANYVTTHYEEGDAHWIRTKMPVHDLIQDEFPGDLVSFKAHCLDKTNNTISIPETAKIIGFHGQPRPHTITSTLITDHWQYR